MLISSLHPQFGELGEGQGVMGGGILPCHSSPVSRDASRSGLLQSERNGLKHRQRATVEQTGSLLCFINGSIAEAEAFYPRAHNPSNANTEMVSFRIAPLVSSTAAQPERRKLPVCATVAMESC